jgi:hypothetical protein
MYGLGCSWSLLRAKFEQKRAADLQREQSAIQQQDYQQSQQSYQDQASVNSSSSSKLQLDLFSLNPSRYDSVKHSHYHSHLAGPDSARSGAGSRSGSGSGSGIRGRSPSPSPVAVSIESESSLEGMKRITELSQPLYHQRWRGPNVGHGTPKVPKISTNHIGRQRPPPQPTGPIDKLNPHEPAPSNNTVSIQDFDKWLETNKRWRETAEQKIVDRKLEEDRLARSISTPRYSQTGRSLY